MTRRIINAFGAAVIGAVVLASVWRGLPAQGQSSNPLSVGEFSRSEYFDAPNQDKIKTTITGGQAQLLSNDRFLIKQLKLETFSVTGGREIIVEAPECLYDSKERQVNSSGHLSVQTGDGRYFVEGDGFLWRQNENTLVISNRVHTVIRNLSATTTKP